MKSCQYLSVCQILSEYFLQFKRLYVCNQFVNILPWQGHLYSEIWHQTTSLIRFCQYTSERQQWLKKKKNPDYSGEENFEGSWWQSWSRDVTKLIRINFHFQSSHDLSYEIWFQITWMFLRETSLNFEIWVTLAQGQGITLTFNTLVTPFIWLHLPTLSSQAAIV